jgi:LPXTG-motif cell wall-anchored protein
VTLAPPITVINSTTVPTVAHAAPAPAPQPVMKALPPTGSASGQVIASFGVALVVGGIIALVIRQRKETK